MEEPNDIGERGVRLFQEKEERVPENVFQAVSPGVVEKFLQGLDDPVRRERPPERRDAFKWIEAERLGRVGHVEVDEV